MMITNAYNLLEHPAIALSLKDGDIVQVNDTFLKVKTMPYNDSYHLILTTLDSNEKAYTTILEQWGKVPFTFELPMYRHYARHLRRKNDYILAMYPDVLKSTIESGNWMIY